MRNNEAPLTNSKELLAFVVKSTRLWRPDDVKTKNHRKFSILYSIINKIE